MCRTVQLILKVILVASNQNGVRIPYHSSISSIFDYNLKLEKRQSSGIQIAENEHGSDISDALFLVNRWISGTPVISLQIYNGEWAVSL